MSKSTSNTREHAFLCCQHGEELLEQNAEGATTIMELVQILFQQVPVCIEKQTEEPDAPPWCVSVHEDGFWLDCFKTKKQAMAFIKKFGLPVANGVK